MLEIANCIIEWVRDIRQQCIQANVPFSVNNGEAFKRKNGRELDGRTWDSFPEIVSNTSTQQVSVLK